MRYSIRWYIRNETDNSRWEIDQINDKTRIGAEIGEVYDHYDCNRMLHVVVEAIDEIQALCRAWTAFNATLQSKRWRNDMGQLWGQPSNA